MNLVLDIGNTRIKAAVFDGCGGCMESAESTRSTGCTEGAAHMEERIVERLILDEPGTAELEALLKKYPAIESSIVCSTRGESLPAEDFLAGHTRRFIRFDGRTPTPLKNLYLTPDTLGPDRLAAAVGANALYPGKNLLVVDFGTAITIDAVTAGGEYAGGNISPGLSMRFRALSDYTGRLPLITMQNAECKMQNGDCKMQNAECKMQNAECGMQNGECGMQDAECGMQNGDCTEETVFGRSTAEAIEAGVVNGIAFELEGYIERLKDKFGPLTVIFTGGEAKFFENKFKNTIFANYNLVFIGLNTILEYNAGKK